MPRITELNVDHVFEYQPPKEGQKARYNRLKSPVKELAHAILESCPESRERSLALTKLQECRMWANASIALEDVEESGA
jgi:hypothetical protein